QLLTQILRLAEFLLRFFQLTRDLIRMGRARGKLLLSPPLLLLELLLSGGELFLALLVGRRSLRSLAFRFRGGLLGEANDLLPAGPQLVFQSVDPIRLLLEHANLRAESLTLGQRCVQLRTQIRRLTEFFLCYFQLTPGFRPARSARGMFL